MGVHIIAYYKLIIILSNDRCFLWTSVVRGGSVGLNHPKLMSSSTTGLNLYMHFCFKQLLMVSKRSNYSPSLIQAINTLCDATVRECLSCFYNRMHTIAIGPSSVKLQNELALRESSKVSKYLHVWVFHSKTNLIAPSQYKRGCVHTWACQYSMETSILIIELDHREFVRVEGAEYYYSEVSHALQSLYFMLDTPTSRIWHWII